MKSDTGSTSRFHSLAKTNCNDSGGTRTHRGSEQNFRTASTPTCSSAAISSTNFLDQTALSIKKNSSRDHNSFRNLFGQGKIKGCSGMKTRSMFKLNTELAAVGPSYKKLLKYSSSGVQDVRRPFANVPGETFTKAGQDALPSIMPPSGRLPPWSCWSSNSVLSPCFAAFSCNHRHGGGARFL